MRSIRHFAFAAAIAAFPLAFLPAAEVAAGATFAGTVVKVYDGDTFTLDSGVRVRVWGLHAPELRDFLGKTSRDAMRGILLGEPVECETMGQSFDRVVARCKVHGVDPADLLIYKGLARDCPRYSKGYYAPTERQAPIKPAFGLPASCGSRR